MKLLYYKFLVMLFYYIGNFACKFNSECMFDLYQKSMKLSVHYDEKINFWWWKEPLNKYENL